VKADTERQLAPKQPPPKQTFTEANKKWAVGFLTQPRQYELNKDSNYKRALKKKVKEAEPRSTSRSSPRKKRDVPQLGQQAKQTIPPLQVGSSHEIKGQNRNFDYGFIDPYQTGSTQAQLDFPRETGLCLSQLDPYALDQFESAPIAFQYVKGGPMVSPKLNPSQLPTHLRKLNKWYLEVAKEGREMIYFTPGKDHFLGHQEITISMEELFRFFNLRDIDIGIVSCYTL
jgi:hypothetical protein